jgi:hypothetical protein
MIYSRRCKEKFIPAATEKIAVIHKMTAAAL